MADPTLTGDPAPAADDGVAQRRLASRVLAWQRRNPLARRVTEADVTGLGVIALPYSEGAGAAATPLFHQPGLLPGLSHRQLVEFAGRHAVAKRPGADGWPQRDVERADAASEPAPQTRYLLTAALPGRRGQPSRLLLAPSGTAIWGRRPLDLVRVGVACVAGVALLGLLGFGVASMLTGGAATQHAPHAPLPAGAASGGGQAVASRATRSEAAPSTASQAAPAAASSVASGAASAVALSASVPAPSASAIGAAVAALGTAGAQRPPAAPTAPAASTPKATASANAASGSPPAASVPAGAKHEGAASVPAAAASLPAPRLLPMPSRAAMAASAAEQGRPAPVVATGPHYAIVSVPTRQRAAAEATLQRVRQLLGPAIGDLQAQVMPSPQGFVVTLWPLPTQADAERLADVLARRGVPMKWMEF
jgi:hypothetical protein